MTSKTPQDGLAAPGTERFSDRVADYVRYRPTYPRELFVYLRDSLGLRPGQTAADIGSGTGIFTQLLLRQGYRVHAIEPNEPMRTAAEAELGGQAGFHSFAGKAEATLLQDASVDFITAAQAFHWFDVPRARTEFRRILKNSSEGQVLLIWNDRAESGTPFLEEYERLLNVHGTDYREVKHRNIAQSEKLRELFGSDDFHLETFSNEQRFDLEGLKGRARSSSYLPPEGHPAFPALMVDLEEAFRKFQENGQVRFVYRTLLFHGRLAEPSR